MNVLDLFSGIGGFTLGLERAGMRTVAFCEVDPYASAVLARHWPNVPNLGDVRTVGREQIASLEPIDVICGGFPCQDISVAGKGAGLAGERSGLWSEYARLVREIRPRFVIVENVAALLGRGLGEVLGDLAAIGYDAQWHCIPASAVGAPHRRDRIWIVAYADSQSATGREHPGATERSETTAPARPVESRDSGSSRACSWESNVAYPAGEWTRRGRERSDPEPVRSSEEYRRAWITEPDVGRVANGVPSRVDRLRCLGNAVVPQIPEIIGRAIMKAANSA